MSTESHTSKPISKQNNSGNINLSTEQSIITASFELLLGIVWHWDIKSIVAGPLPRKWPEWKWLN